MKTIHIDNLRALVEWGEAMGATKVGLDLIPLHLATRPEPATTQGDYSVPEVAKILRVRRETVLAWIKAGELVAFNVGKRKPRYRVTPAALDAFRARQAAPKPLTNKRRKPPATKDYFPDAA